MNMLEKMLSQLNPSDNIKKFIVVTVTDWEGNVLNKVELNGGIVSGFSPSGENESIFNQAVFGYEKEVLMTYVMLKKTFRHALVEKFGEDMVSEYEKKDIKFKEE